MDTNSDNDRRRGFVQAFGPGLLFAATAVGASHLVQSTRAGASFGLGLIVLIVLTNVIKYPAFRFGVEYANVTGSSLLDGYRNQGRWAIVLYALIALGTMFAAEAAVTLVTAGIAKAVFGIEGNTNLVCAAILTISALILFRGFATLDKLIKVIMIALTVSTLVAAVMLVPRIHWADSFAWFPTGLSAADYLFLAALIGFMPCSIDISVFQSLWVVAKRKETGYAAPLSQSIWDFHIGYGGTIVLALCFVMLGAGVMYQSGTEFQSSSAGFASQLIGLYTQTLGAWSGPVIGGAALAVMFSTVLTGLDGYPRAAVALMRMARGTQSGERSHGETLALSKRTYRTVVVIQALGALAVLQFFSESLKSMVDVAATLAFLFAPLIAFLNHRVIVTLRAQTGHPVSALMQAWSILAILSLLGLAAFYVKIRFG